MGKVVDRAATAPCGQVGFCHDGALQGRHENFCTCLQARHARPLKPSEGREARELVVQVDEVVKEWRSNKAENSKSLEGKRVLVVAPNGEGQIIARFVASLKVGETVTLDVAHKKGEALTILELTEDQRERIQE